MNEKIVALEEYVRNNLGIPIVSFNDLDFEVANEIVEAFRIIFERYPALQNAICAIGDFEDINNQYNIIRNSHKSRKEIKWKEFYDRYDIYMSSVSINYSSESPILEKLSILIDWKLPNLRKKIIEPTTYIALIYGMHYKMGTYESINKDIEYGARLGGFTKHSTSIKSVVYHEIGHVLDYILNFSKNDEFIEFVKSKSNGFKTIKEDISKNADRHITELVAEAFSEYILCPNSNELIFSIGQFIDEEYLKYEKSGVFDINYRYKQDIEKSNEKSR